MFNVQERGHECCEQDVVEFEKFIHAKLPDDYREFISKWNGCIPSKDCDTFKSPVKLPGGNDVTVEVFYSLSKLSPKLGNLHKMIETHVGVVSFESIPIGHDSFGNLICLNCQTGLVSWVLMEAKYTFDCYRDFEFNVTFNEFFNALGPGPYALR